jgi:5-formyltetrahydrofolate cyclo-ligase
MTDIARRAEADRIARQLAKIALPDSRFHRDYTRFIPGFPDSGAAAAQALKLVVDIPSGPVFCTLEASLWDLRQGLLALGHEVVMPTYGLHRGLLRLPATIPASERRFATSLDGAEVLGIPVPLDHRFTRPAEVLFCGAYAVTTSGLRFGLGAGYIDLEWWICNLLGLVDAATQVVAVVDRCQLSSAQFEREPDELVCSHIATQDALHSTGAKGKPVRPPRLDFDPSLWNNPLVAAALAE